METWDLKKVRRDAANQTKKGIQKQQHDAVSFVCPLSIYISLLRVRTSSILATVLQGSEGIVQLLVDRRGRVSQQDSNDPAHIPSSCFECLAGALKKEDT